MAARALPFDLSTSFLLLTAASLLATAVVLYLVLREWRFDHQSAILGMLVFFAPQELVKFNLHDFWLTDSFVFLFVVLAIYAILRDDDLLFAASLVLGVLSKPTVLVVVPLYVTLPWWRGEERDLADLGHVLRDRGPRLLALLAPALAALVATSLIVDTQGSYLWDALTRYPVHHASLLAEQGVFGLLRFTAYFGIATVLLFLHPARVIEELPPWLPIVALVYAQLLVAHDVGRLLVLWFPAFAVLSLESVEAFTRSLGDLTDRVALEPVHLSVVPLTAIGANLFVGGARPPSIPVRLAGLGAAVAAILAIGLWRARRSGDPAPS